MRHILCFALFIVSFASLANAPKPLYQIDLIVFAQQSSSQESNDHELSPIIAAESPKAIKLKPFNGTVAPYRLLPQGTSTLRSELWSLKHNGDFKILANYSWLQPANNQRPIVLPNVDQDGWNIEGTVRVRESNYFILDTDLLFSAPHNTDTSFVFSQKHRLLNDKLYYLDHPQAGMLIKIHKLT
jgi:hypothetical protein